jgi:hypothetical protein
MRFEDHRSDFFQIRRRDNIGSVIAKLPRQQCAFRGDNACPDARFN